MALSSSPWYDTVLKVISIVKLGIDSVKGLVRFKEMLKKDYTILNIRDGLEDDSLEIGGRVHAIGQPCRSLTHCMPHTTKRV